MPDPAFSPFGTQHLAAVIIGCLSIIALIVIARRSPGAERGIRCLLAFLNLAVYAFSQWAWSVVSRETSIDNTVPLHLCDLAAFLAGFALITGNRTCILLAYFWGLAGTIQGIATPAIDIGYPHPAFFSFFVQHFAVIAAAIYFPVVLGWRAESPLWKSPLKAFGWLNLYVLIAIGANQMLGSNFGFLAHKPENPSILDHLGAHPGYILSLELIALVLFFLLALPIQKPASGDRD